MPKKAKSKVKVKLPKKKVDSNKKFENVRKKHFGMK